MPEIEIRPAISDDIPRLIQIDHGYTSDYVWQMDIQAEENQVMVSFRELRLPRSVRVEYPRPVQTLADDWTDRSAVLIARLGDQPAGYICLMKDLTPVTIWITDLVVERRYRRQGIGSALVLAAQNWARKQGVSRLVLEMQPKNHAAIRMAEKLGFTFCGYNDRYYANHDIALFFGKPLH
jgi:ribosomal protein S18 acetylase RimI-like enzyme